MSPTPHPFLLPTTSSTEDLTILTLPHPRTSTPTRYLLHPSKGLYELTKITTTSSSPRSWLLSLPSNSPKNIWLETGHILEDDALYVSTPIDPLFLILQKLVPAEEKKALFLPMDDLLDSLFSEDEEDFHWSAVINPGSITRQQIEARVRVVCEKVDVSGEDAFRVSEEKILVVLAEKCRDMVRGGLPKSLEEEFVLKVLGRPVTAEPPASSEETGENQGEEMNAEDTEMDRTTADKKTDTSEPSEDIKYLLRLRTALKFLSGTYLPAHISTLLSSHISTLHNFVPLDEYLAELKQLKAEANSLRADDFSLKRKLDDDEGEDAKLEKKRKAEEEKKKVKTRSKGVKALGKVNTRGMAKLTSFFKKM